MQVKERALRPREKDLGLSVFRSTGQDDDQIWSVGVEHVLRERQAKEPAAKLYARADFNAAAPLELGLALAFDEPPPEHVLISAWPDDKFRRIELAQELAARAFLKVPAAPLS